MRNENIDILRFIGLAMIILAHVGPPGWLFQLRNFDVPLMVLISGVSYSLSHKIESYAAYLWKRVKRLLFPVWIFLTTYFFLMSVTGYPKPLPDLGTIATSYTLISGIGYVWVIRVFLMVALLAPFLHSFISKVNSNLHYYISLALIYFGYELLLYLTKPYLESAAGQLILQTFFYFIPYSIIFAMGLRFIELSQKQVIIMAVVSCLVFSIFAGCLFEQTGKFNQTQLFKYPPSLYYLTYALTASSVLWLMAEKIVKISRWLKIIKPILFVAQNSIWVYLWHIPLIEIVQLPYYFKYLVVFFSAAVITFVQVYLVRNLLIPKVSNIGIKKDLNMLLTG